MNKKLELSALTADLASVDAVLNQLSEADFLGRSSFQERKNEILRSIESLKDAPDTSVSVALFFDGEPVKDTTSIEAKFASSALASFQDMVTKDMAHHNRGGLAQKGPVPDDKLSRLRITNVVHGSFGFLLEEDAEETAMFDTPLKKAVENVTDILDACIAPTERKFDEALEQMDNRFFNALKNFFSTMHANNSLFKLVQSDIELVAKEEEVERAFERVSMAMVTEDEIEIRAQLIGVVPADRRFQIRTVEDGEDITGKLGPTFSAEYLRRIEDDRSSIPIGEVWTAKLVKKVTRTKTGKEKETYTLLSLP